MYKKCIIVTICNIIVLTSLLFLTKVFFKNQQYLSMFNSIKLICLCLQHITLFIMMLVTLKCQTLDHFILWTHILTFLLFFKSLFAEVTCYVLTKTFLFLSFRYQYELDLISRRELSVWQNIYFEVTLYSLIWCLFLTIRFIGKKIMQCLQKKRRSDFINNFLEPVQLKALIQQNTDQQNLQCPICLLQYEDTDKIIKSNCKHVFHFDCLKSWLYTQNKCPLCRMQFY